MVFSELYSSALDHELGSDDSTRLFTTGRRQRAINRGLQEFADLTECCLRQSTITCSNGVGEYNLLSTVILANGDYLRLSAQMPEFHLVSSGSSASTTITAGADFPRRDIPWLNDYTPGWKTSTGATPQFHYLRADGGRLLFGMSPPPRIGSSEVGRVVLPYLAKPSSMASDTDIPFTFGSTVRSDLEPYHVALVHFAAGELEKLRRDHEASQFHFQQFLGYVQRYVLAQRPPGGQTVRLGRSYFAEVTDRRGRDDWTRSTPYPWRT